MVDSLPCFIFKTDRRPGGTKQNQKQKNPPLLTEKEKWQIYWCVCVGYRADATLLRDVDWVYPTEFDCWVDDTGQLDRYANNCAAASLSLGIKSTAQEWYQTHRLIHETGRQFHLFCRLLISFFFLSILVCFIFHVICVDGTSPDVKEPVGWHQREVTVALCVMPDDA